MTLARTMFAQTKNVILVYIEGWRPCGLERSGIIFPLL
jgi:hypothetical protein